MSSTVIRNTWDNVVLVTRNGNTDATWDGAVNCKVYDVGTMAWVAMTQPATGAGGGGDASAANQTTEITKLTSIDGKLVSQSVSSASLTSVAAAASSTSILASNSSRKGAKFYNDSTSDAYLAFAASATTSAFTVKMVAGSYYSMELPVYTGAISAIWDTANGSMRITEL